jgi:hypothetical protein
VIAIDVAENIKKKNVPLVLFFENPCIHKIQKLFFFKYITTCKFCQFPISTDGIHLTK